MRVTLGGKVVVGEFDDGRHKLGVGFLVCAIIWSPFVLQTYARGEEPQVVPVSEPITVWNGYEGYRPRTKPGDLDSEGIQPKQGARTLKFGELLVATHCCSLGEVIPSPASEEAIKAARHKMWLLVVEADSQGQPRAGSQPLGWVEGKYLVFAEALKNPITGLHKKAFLVRDIRMLQNLVTNAGGQDSAKRDLFEEVVAGKKAPRHDAPSNQKIKFHEFLYVFAETGKNPETDWVLLGTEYQLDLSAQSVFFGRVVGWFPLAIVQIWHTREAVQFNSRPERAKGPGKIWLTPEDALQAKPGTFLSNTPTPLFSERFLNGKPVPITPRSLRFPVLDWPEREKYRTQFPEGWELVKVGVEGALVDQEGNPLMNAEEIRELREKLRSLEAAIQNLQLLLVIDDTESMKPWFPVAARAIEEAIQKLWSGHQGTFWLAITYYSDYDRLDPTFVPVRTQQLTNDEREIRRRLQELRTHEVRRGYDPREMVFEGIIRGIRAARFDPLATKVVIVIGDDADKSDENDPMHAAEQMVVRELTKFPSPVHFLAIQVYPADRLKERPVAAAFRKQMETICQIYSRSERTVGFTAEVISSDEIPTVVGTVQNYLAAVRDQQIHYKDRLQKLRLGDVPAQVEKGIELVLRELGVAKRLEELARFGAFQLYHEGYVWVPRRGNNVPSETELVLLLSQRDFEDRVLPVLNELFGQLAEGDWDPAKLRELLDTALGEETRNRLDALLKSVALVDSGTTLRRLLTGQADTEDLYRLQGFRIRLEDILKGLKFEYRRLYGDSGVWMRSGEPTLEERWFRSFTGEIRYYWIRVWDEWP